MAVDRIIFPPGQGWLIKRAETLDSKVNKTGLCFAIANMAMQAVLADDLETFENRLKTIYKIDPKEFKAKLENLEGERRKIIERVKAENKEIQKDELEALEKDDEVDEKIKRLVEIFEEDAEKLQKELTKEQIKDEFEKRKKNILFNAFLQKKIDKQILELPEEDHLALDIPIFFQNVNLYQTPYKYPDLFEAKSRPMSQNTLVTLPLVAPKKIKEPSEIFEVSDFSGAYTQTEVIQYFKSFSDTIEKFTPSITHRIPFILNSGNHTITVIYDPRQKNWLFIDANQLQSPTPRFSAEELGAKVVSAFSKNEITTFSTKIYAHQSKAETLKNFLNQWKDNETFKEIHSVTRDKISYSDSYNATWLHVATKNGHIETVEALLMSGAKPNLATNDDGATPLYVAAQEGYTEIIEALLMSGANPNLPNFKGHTKGDTPLFVAAQNGHTEIVEALLMGGANPNLANNVSPLFIAAQNGHKNVVLALLANEASLTFPFKSNSDSLNRFAKNHHVEKAMETFILKYQEDHKQNPTPEIYLSPKDIAKIMGHTEIVELLNLAEQNEKQDISNLSFFKPKQIQTKDELEAKSQITIPTEIVKSPLTGAQIRNFSGAYTEDEVSNLFENFSKTLEEFTPRITHRISFRLSSSHQAITVIYDPHSPPKNWLFINSRYFANPTPRFSSSELGSKVVSAFSENGITTFATKIYTHRSNAEKLNEFLQLWQKNETFKKIHNITPDKLIHSDSDNTTWLYIAAQNGHTENVKALLKAGARVNLADKNGLTPLFIAAHNNHTDTVKALLEAKANPNVATIIGVTPLHIAAQAGHTETVKALLNAQANPNLVSNKGNTSLFLAAQNGHTETVQALLNAQANPNVAVQDGDTPLYVAARNGHTEIVKALLKAKANPNVVINGVTPLYISAENGHTEIVEALLISGAPPNSADLKGNTPLYIASKNGHTEIVKTLLKAKANPNVVINGVTPLYIAAENGHTETVKALLKAGAKVNLADKNGITPLYIAAQNGHKGVVLALLADGLSSFIPSKTNIGFLREIAKKHKVEEAMEKTITAYQNKKDFLSSLFFPSEISLTPKDIATIMGHKEIVEFLAVAEFNKKHNISDVSFFKHKQVETQKKLEVKPEVTQTPTFRPIDDS